MSKSYDGRITKWVWDGNVILHEWVERFEDISDEDDLPDSVQSDETSAASLQAQLDGRPSNGPPESGYLPTTTTWLYDPDTFAPASKIVGHKYYSIITDHLGTPLSMFDENGVLSWGAELDIYGNVKNLQGDRSDCPFRYPGQYEDCESGLYYNRFRYYDPDGGVYVSQDPIQLAGNNPNIYAYVKDPNAIVDIYGLSCTPKDAQKKVRKKQGPRQVTRIDAPEQCVPGSQWHAHGKNWGARNLDGSIHDADPNFSRNTLDWLREHGWKV